MNKVAVIDSDKCIGCNFCVEICLNNSLLSLLLADYDVLKPPKR